MARVILQSKFLVSNWSGGKITQMAIYPEGATYAARDFMFRISSATVDSKISDFTLLPNISRIIMVLKGAKSALSSADENACAIIAKI